MCHVSVPRTAPPLPWWPTDCAHGVGPLRSWSPRGTREKFRGRVHGCIRHCRGDADVGIDSLDMIFVVPTCRHLRHCLTDRLSRASDLYDALASATVYIHVRAMCAGTSKKRRAVMSHVVATYAKVRQDEPRILLVRNLKPGVYKNVSTSERGRMPLGD